MSTELEFPCDLSKIRLPAIKFRSGRQHAASDRDDEVDASENNNVEVDFDDGEGIVIIQQAAAESDRDEEEFGERDCRTPTSVESRIQEIFSPPPAPCKPRRTVSLSCKRKLTEVEFFEIVNRDEVEEFFKSSFELAFGTASAKRSSR